MSDILIRDMEMPSDCDSCFIPGSFCPLWINTDVGSRHTDCPLIPVPPHGRLIDADVLEDRCSRQARDEWNKSTGTNWGYAYATFESDVEDAPTIIQASDKDTNVLGKEEGEDG